METLGTILLALLEITGILFLLIIIFAIISTPFTIAKKKKKNKNMRIG